MGLPQKHVLMGQVHGQMLMGLAQEHALMGQAYEQMLNVMGLAHSWARQMSTCSWDLSIEHVLVEPIP